MNGHTGTTVVPGALRDARRLDITLPPPLLLLPLRLEYRVLDKNVPVSMAGPVAELLKLDTDVSIVRDRAPSLVRAGRTGAPDRWSLARARVTFKTRKEVWFRWFPDDDFTLRGIPPPQPPEEAALSEFDASIAGSSWSDLDDPTVVSAWQALSRAVAPERALHLLRHRGQPGDPRYSEAIGRIALAPEKVALFALDQLGVPTLLGEGRPIDADLRYSFAHVQAGGWHTDFDAAIAAGMGLRLVREEAVARALDARWIVAVGLFKGDGAKEITKLLEDAIANGGFAFLEQDTPTNNTPDEPTPYQAPQSDLLTFLRTAVNAEAGVLASPLTQSAELLADAFGVDVTSLAKAPLSGDLALEDARSMLRVVGPALIDRAVESTEAVKTIDEEEFIEFFVESIAARGPLPPVRFGKNPYGVLPVVDLTSLSTLASDSADEKRIEAFVRSFAVVAVKLANVNASQSVPVIEPGDPAAAQKLEQILKLNPVSRRLEVGGAGDTQPIGCAYVTSKEHPPTQYLADLGRRPIGELPDPTAGEVAYPLLYRLARLSLSKVTVLRQVSKTPGLTGLKVNTRVHLDPDEQRKVDAATTKITGRSLRTIARDRTIGGIDSAIFVTSARFLSALERLEAIAREPRGVAKLETLLMECIDLFQSRIDAWATGIAYRRLVKRRRAGRKGLVGGYWGLLGKLRPASATGRTDGYLQAPSPHQAMTAALLRSAHLRHQESGAFAIGLESARARKGLKLLELLQAGISPNQALGYLAERKLHDRNQDHLVFKLRDLFPLRDPRDDAAIETRLSDGLAFMKATLATPPVEPAQLEPLRVLQRDLQEDFDALSDIVLAEATHLRAMGQADGANAWLQVLSGDTVPGIPTVLRTRRAGHGSTHRVAVLVDPVEAVATATPRAIAEPSLAALLTSRLAGFGAALVEVNLCAADGSEITKRVTLRELGLAPIDLLVGGEGEVVLRAKHWVVSRWSEDRDLGPLPDQDLVKFLNEERKLNVVLPAGTRSLVAASAELRRAVAQGRPLEPGDLSAAADPSLPLKDADERELLSASAAKLAVRANLLATRLAADATALMNAAGPVVAAARNWQRLHDGAADKEELTVAMTRLSGLRPALDAVLLKVSRYAEPAALRLITTAGMAAAPDDLERSLAALAERLNAKQSVLASAVSSAPVAVNAAAARERRDSLVAALRHALDGDALPILPIVGRIPGTTPLLQPDSAATSDPLAEWAAVRARVARAKTLFKDAPWRAYLSAEAATGADVVDPEDGRSEELAPRAHLFGTFFAPRRPESAATFAGFVADEWAEQRPSEIQRTGLAINYDAPQSEPPHALLLAEPSSQTPWSPEAAAKIVSQTVALMKARARVAQEQPVPGTLFPHANQVPFKASQPRIPTRPLRFLAGGPVVHDGVFFVQPGNMNLGVSGSGLFEISGFGKVED